MRFTLAEVHECKPIVPDSNRASITTDDPRYFCVNRIAEASLCTVAKLAGMRRLKIENGILGISTREKTVCGVASLCYKERETMWLKAFCRDTVATRNSTEKQNSVRSKIHRVLWKQLNVRQISFDSVSVLYKVPLKLARSNSRISDSSGG